MLNNFCHDNTTETKRQMQGKVDMANLTELIMSAVCSGEAEVEGMCSAIWSVKPQSGLDSGSSYITYKQTLLGPAGN